MDGLLSMEQTGLAVALGAGLLIGLDRERRKGTGPDRRAAGLRTFMVAALAGAMAQIVSEVLAAVALAGVTGLAALSYWRSRSLDPGLTTEVALIATVLIGMLAVPHPALAAGCAVVLAGVLAAKDRLHRFATEWLTQEELHDGLLLSALALVLMPLLPASRVEWLGPLSPRQMLMLVIVILVMQGLSHVARRLLGNRSGLALSGLLGGFVSSTATISAMGSLAREGRAPMRLCWCAAVLSMAATWLQLLLMSLVVAPRITGTLVPFVAWGVAVPLLLGLLLWRQGDRQASSDALTQGRVLRVREAMIVSALLLGGAVLVNLAQRMGTGGLLAGTAVAAFADAHAPMASLMALAGSGRIDHAMLITGLLVALAANGATRATAAYLSGGARFGHVVAGALLFNLLWAGIWLGGFGR
ncbi:MAG: DUF4010 domain-containing protein [Aquabacterium sp.]